MVAHSTFPLVTALRGHGVWYYHNPGGSGFANPGPVPIEGIGLERHLEIAVEQHGDDSGSASEQLAVLSRGIEQAVTEEVSDDNPRKALYFEHARQIDFLMKEVDDGPGSLPWFLRVAAFAAAFNLEWYAVG